MTSTDGDTKIALIGAGAMGSAILKGWLSADEGVAADLSAGDFWVVEPTETKARALADELDVNVVSSVEKLRDHAFDIIVLAVKPQVMGGVLDELSASGVLTEGIAEKDDSPLVVSIAAGVTTETISRMLESSSASSLGSGKEAAVRIVRVMPNLPLQVGRGASVVAGGKNASENDVQLVKELFSTLGFAETVDEDQIDAVCAISGGGPAYVAYMIEALTKAGVDAGLRADLAEKLAIATFDGTCAQLKETQTNPAQLRKAVCSPGGTTLAALAAMDEGGFTEAVQAGIRGAIDRAKELSEC